jgi:hypothetical protein
LYFTNNSNQNLNNNEDFIFEKPFNIDNYKADNVAARNNHYKFSNTEIPEVLDECYIQKRINKAEINIPNGEFNNQIINNDKYILNQSFNPIQEIQSNRRRVSSRLCN